MERRVLSRNLEKTCFMDKEGDMRQFFKVCPFLLRNSCKQSSVIFLADVVQVMNVQTCGCKNSVAPNKSYPVLDKNVIHHP